MDTVGAVSEDATITVTVEADDDAPTAITLSEIPVAENTEGAVVATVTVDDVDSTYVAADLDLTDPSGKFELADDNGAVVLKLKVGEALDFEATEQPSVVVTLPDDSLSSAPFSPTVTNVDEAGPLALAFDDGTLESYTSNQDKPGAGGTGATISGDGNTLTLNGNLWKRAPLGEEYTITDKTELTLTVTISTSPAPEIVAVGFDNDNGAFNGQPTGAVFQIGGTQPQGAFINLAGTGAVVDNGDGTLSVTIDLSAYAGTSINSLVFIADDDVASNGLGTATFSNVILDDSEDSGGNSAPVVVGGGVADLEANEQSSIEIDLAFVDPDGDDLTYEIEVSDGSGMDATGDFEGITASDGVLSGSLEDAAPGIYTITVTASDGSLSTQDTFTLTVLDINEAPEADADAAFEPVFGEVGSAIAPIDVGLYTGVFSDPDGDTLTYAVEDLPDGLSIDNDGVITGTPLETGNGTFTLVATDPGGLSASVEIPLIIEGLEVGDVTVIEAEDFTGLAAAGNFTATGQVGASGNEIIRAGNSANASTITTDLTANGLVEGFYTVAMTRYDETDGSATYSLTIGETVLADEAAFDGTPNAETGTDTFDNTSPRGNAGQPGNLKTLVFDTPVFVTAGTILTLSGQANGELLRTDKFTFTRIDTPNTAPTDIVLTGSVVAENEFGAALGVLSATDPEENTISFSVDPDSDFEVVNGNELKLKDTASLDFEAGDTVEVLVTATDAPGLASSQLVTLTVTDVDEAPEAIGLDISIVDENLPGAVIGTLTATDPEGGVVTFSADAASDFEIVGGQLKLKDGISLDYEAGETVTVAVTASDGTNDATIDVTLTVADVNEAPSLTGDLLDLDLDQGQGATVALDGLVATDPDDGQIPTLSLSEANVLAGFSIEGDELTIPASLASGVYEVNIFATDGELNSEFRLLHGDRRRGHPLQPVCDPGGGHSSCPAGDLGQ